MVPRTIGIRYYNSAFIFLIEESLALIDSMDAQTGIKFSN
jgi:hypothetical protein